MLGAGVAAVGFTAAVVLMTLGGERDVDRREKAEDQDLDESDQRAEHHDRDGREQREDPEDDRQQKVVDSDVEHEPDTQGERPDHEGRDELDDEDEDVDRQHPDAHPWPGEVGQGADAVGLEAVIGKCDENDQGAADA